jgi:hypothetical protein
MLPREILSVASATPAQDPTGTDFPRLHPLRSPRERHGEIPPRRDPAPTSGEPSPYPEDAGSPSSGSSHLEGYDPAHEPRPLGESRDLEVIRPSVGSLHRRRARALQRAAFAMRIINSSEPFAVYHEPEPSRPNESSCTPQGASRPNLAGRRHDRLPTAPAHSRIGANLGQIAPELCGR